MAGLLQNIKSLRYCEGIFFFSEGFLIYIPQQLLWLCFIKLYWGKVCLIFLTCWKSGYMSVPLEFFATYHIPLCISGCRVSACNQTTVGCGLIQSHRGCKSRLENLHMAEMEILVLHRYNFLLLCKISDFHSCRSASLILKLLRKDVKHNLYDLSLLLTYSKYKWHVYGRCPWNTCVSLVSWYCSWIAQECTVNGTGNINSLKTN